MYKKKLLHTTGLSVLCKYIKQFDSEATPADYFVRPACSLSAYRSTEHLVLIFTKNLKSLTIHYCHERNFMTKQNPPLFNYFFVTGILKSFFSISCSYFFSTWHNTIFIFLSFLRIN